MEYVSPTLQSSENPNYPKETSNFFKNIKNTKENIGKTFGLISDYLAETKYKTPQDYENHNVMKEKFGFHSDIMIKDYQVGWFDRLRRIFGDTSEVIKSVKLLPEDTAKYTLAGILVTLAGLGIGYGAKKLYEYVFEKDKKEIEEKPKSTALVKYDTSKNRGETFYLEPITGITQNKTKVEEPQFDYEFESEDEPDEIIIKEEPKEEKPQEEKTEEEIKEEEKIVPLPIKQFDTIPKVVRAEIDSTIKILKKAELRKIELKDDTAKLQSQVYTILQHKVYDEYNYEGNLNKYFKPSLFRGYY